MSASLPYIVYAENTCFSRNFIILKHCVQHFNDFTKSSDSGTALRHRRSHLKNFVRGSAPMNWAGSRKRAAAACRRQKNPRAHGAGALANVTLLSLRYHCAFPKEHTNVKRFCDIYFFSISASFQRSVWMSNGFAMCSFMPAARAFSRSSAKAFAVMATIGICAFSGSGSARIRRVAS